jgi:surface protein
MNMQKIKRTKTVRLKNFTKLTLKSNVWAIIAPIITVVAGASLWLLLALNDDARAWFSQFVISVPAPLDSTQIFWIALSMFIVAALGYFWIDYRQNLSMLKKSDPSFTYSPGHHAKKVLVPKLKYNWKQSLYWLGYGLVSLFVFSVVFTSQIKTAYAAGPYVGPHGSDVFVMLVDTSEQGYSSNNQFKITFTLAGPAGWSADMNFDVDCDNDGVWDFTNQTGGPTVTCDYPVPGTYSVAISGTLTRTHFNSYGSSDAQKILEIQQWGDTPWEYMSFGGASNMSITALDIPNLSNGTSLGGVFSGNYNFNSNINNWDVSHVTSMSGMFQGATSFNQPLNNWDVGNVTNMRSMFRHATSFNQPLNNWDTSSVEITEEMFQRANSFSQPLSNWDTGQVTDMSYMFGDRNAPQEYNQDISSWDTSSVTDMTGMFNYNTSFNQPIGAWDVSQVESFSGMFANNPSFNQSLASWNTSSAVSMGNGHSPFDAFFGMFQNATAFNGDIANWDTSNVTDMSRMFQGATSFNQPIGNWNVSSVTTMRSMFEDATAYNKNSSNWDMGNAIIMRDMFRGATTFNGTITNWNTSSVTNMYRMFQGATSFNQPLNSWDVSQVTTMFGTFEGATSFNQPLNSWNTTSVINMQSMFRGATIFNEDISSWNTSNVTRMSSMFSNAVGFDKSVNDWDVANVTGIHNMFQGATSFNQPLNSWDVSSVTDMSGTFEGATSFNGDTANWNTSSVQNISGMFKNATSFNQPIGNWNTSSVTTMAGTYFGDGMFEGATSFNQPLNSWDVSQITDMGSMFEGATSFNQPLNSWDVSNVTDMSYMFGDYDGHPYYNEGATSFNQDIDIWDTGALTNAVGIFRGATSFNQPLNNWDTSNVINISSMFQNATSFNQPLNNWDTSNVDTMWSVFYKASSFDQNIGMWNVGKVTSMTQIFRETDVSYETYDAILLGWSEQTLMNNVNMSQGYGIYYCNSVDERAHIIDTYNWNITGDYQLCPPEVTTGSVQAISAGSATAQINILAGPPHDAGIEYGLDTSYSDLTRAPSYGVGVQDVDITGLDCGATYHFRAYATNGIGSVHGEDSTFTTKPCVDHELSISLVSDTPVLAGDDVEYSFKVSNLGPVVDGGGGIFFYILMPDSAVYKSTSFNGVNELSSCTDYGSVTSVLPYASFSTYTGNLLGCSVLPEPALGVGDSSDMRVVLEVTEDFVVDSTTMRGLIVGSQETDTQLLSEAIVGTEPIYSISSNNIFNHVYGVSVDSNNDTSTEEPQDNNTEEDNQESSQTLPTANNDSTPRVSRGTRTVLQDPFDYLDTLVKGELKTNQLEQQNTNILLTFVSGAGKNIPWVLLQIMGLSYLLQAFLEARNNKLVRARIILAKRSKEGLDGFLHIAAHYLVTPVTTMSLSMEGIRPQTETTATIRSQLTDLKSYVNQLIAGLNTKAAEVKEKLEYAGKIKRHSVIKLVIIPVAAAGIMLVGIVGASQLGAWSISQNYVIFNTVLLIASIGSTLLFFELWQRQRQLTADLKATHMDAEEALQTRKKFIVENKQQLEQKFSPIESHSEKIPENSFKRTFNSGKDQFNKVLVAFTEVTRLTSRTTRAAKQNSWNTVPLISQLSQRASKSAVKFHYNGPSTISTKLSDDEVEKVVNTLVENSLNFTESDSVIDVSIAQQNKKLLITIKDNGVGISKAKLKTLMQPFARGTDAHTYDYKGIGLNLYIVRLIAERYSGKLEIKSSESKGTIVTFTA